MWKMTRCNNHILSKDVCHANQPLPWIARRRGMSYKWGCINTYFMKFNMFNSFLSLQNLFSSNGLVNISASWSSVPTLSIQMSPFVGDLLWNDGGHQYALFLYVEPDCWSTWLHSHCHIAMALSWTWFQSHSRWPSSKVFMHNNYQPDMYSTSVVDNATLFCFFDDHEISDLPNNWHVPEMLFLSTLHPT